MNQKYAYDEGRQLLVDKRTTKEVVDYENCFDSIEVVRKKCGLHWSPTRVRQLARLQYANIPLVLLKLNFNVLDHVTKELPLTGEVKVFIKDLHSTVFHLNLNNSGHHRDEMT
jgi:hypothetical protein